MSTPASARAVLALALVLLAGSALAAGQAPAGTTGAAGGSAGSAGGTGNGTTGSNAVNLNLYEFEAGSSFVIEPSGIALIPGENVTLTVHNIGQIQHNFYVGEGGSVAKIDPLIDPGKSATVSFQVPATGPLLYYCNVVGHAQAGMQGNITIKGAPVAGAAATAGQQVAALTKLGVSYYAYWVGVIAFVVLFAVLAVTFFVLRYGESRHWTDQRDRPVRKEGEAPRRPVGTWVAMALVAIVALVAAAQVLSIVR